VAFSVGAQNPVQTLSGISRRVRPVPNFWTGRDSRRKAPEWDRRSTGHKLFSGEHKREMPPGKRVAFPFCARNRTCRPRSQLTVRSAPGGLSRKCPWIRRNLTGSSSLSTRLEDERDMADLGLPYRRGKLTDANRTNQLRWPRIKK
jgi:hypothetical protein